MRATAGPACTIPLGRRRSRRRLRSRGTVPQAQLLPTLVTSVLVPYNSVWSYKDDGGAWYAAGFYQNSYDYSGWATGSAIFGNGTLDSLPAGESVRTTIANPTNASRTYPFKRTFSIRDRDAVTSLVLRTICDDGIVVWINGTEVGSVMRPTTLADNVDATGLGGNEGVPQVITLTGSQLDPLVTGTNYIAMLGLDSGAASTDSAFGCRIEVTEWYNKAVASAPPESFFTLHTYKLAESVLVGATDMSGCFIDPDDRLLYVVRNTNHIRKLTLSGAAYGSEVNLNSPVNNSIDDAESLCRIAGHSSGREWATTDEGDTTPGYIKIHLFDLARDDSAISNVLTYDFTGIIGAVTGYGSEGLAYRSSTDKFYIVTQEVASGGLWECTIGASPSATRLFTWMDSLVAGGAAASNAYVSDLVDMGPLGRDTWMVIVNDNPLATGGARLVEFSRTGTVLGTFELPMTGQTEGLCFDLSYPYDMYIVGEQQSGANFWRYSPEEKLLHETSSPTDSVTVTASAAVTDAGGGTDAAQGLTASATVSDSGGGTDAAQGLTASVALTDAGGGSEATPSMDVVSPGPVMITRTRVVKSRRYRTTVRRSRVFIPWVEPGLVTVQDVGVPVDSVAVTGRGWQPPMYAMRRHRFRTQLVRGMR